MALKVAHKNSKKKSTLPWFCIMRYGERGEKPSQDDGADK
jgi:hypothetical protein